MIENKFPGKDITFEDIKNKIPLVAKKNINHKSKFKISGIEFGGKKIPIFAGPNMVESKKLIFDVAKNVKKIGASFLRGGAFKPLTFPYRSEKYYETREEGIKWLGEAKEKYNIPIITEIMETKYLDLICDVADILQIGSRNMQNYPLLIDCAKSMKPIMLKRHYGASLRDWLGAAEYIMYHGNPRVILCERGVSVPHTHRDTSRYLLDLQVVVAAKEITHLPIVVDPSHATFWRPWVKNMAFASIASGADGIMLEVHPNPEKSAVDPLQPINYKDFKKLFKKMNAIAKVSHGRKL
jgi:3-deoxy-7-phosphoheptulonate synthase